MTLPREHWEWWEKTTRRLLSYIIGGDRDWPALFKFGAWSGWGQDFTRQAVASLYEEKKISYNYRTKMWTVKSSVVDSSPEDHHDDQGRTGDSSPGARSRVSS